jgi:hypothetical protein
MRAAGGDGLFVLLILPKRLEFHHVMPFAVGGTATVENIELRCLELAPGVEAPTAAGLSVRGGL